jgi:hypothetical protein
MFESETKMRIVRESVKESHMMVRYAKKHRFSAESLSFQDPLEELTETLLTSQITTAASTFNIKKQVSNHFAPSQSKNQD